MSNTSPPDPAAFFRTLIGDWDKISRSFQGAGGAQEAFKGVAERALSAANMPSRAELEEVSARLARVEGALFRLEGKIDSLAQAVAAPPTPTPVA